MKLGRALPVEAGRPQSLVEQPYVRRRQRKASLRRKRIEHRRDSTSALTRRSIRSAGSVDVRAARQAREKRPAFGETSTARRAIAQRPDENRQ